MLNFALKVYVAKKYVQKGMQKIDFFFLQHLAALSSIIPA